MEEAEALAFFAEIFDGAHKIPGKIRRLGHKTWRLTAYVGSNGVSTFDDDVLTRLVLLAHERAIRLAICPSSPRYLGVDITKRTSVQSLVEGHPTIDEAVEKWGTSRFKTWVHHWRRRRDTRRFRSRG